MGVHLHREINSLKNKILLMCGKVEAALATSINAINKGDIDLANQVIEDDVTIDLYEVEIEEDCLKILALYQPVAIDLRFVIGVIKINNDLERIADLAVNIAERAQAIITMRRFRLPENLNIMAGKVQSMLNDSIDALINFNETLARDIIKRDDEIDDFHHNMFTSLKHSITANPSDIDYLINLLSLSRYLERAADQITNIAEDVVYMVTGEIIRHNDSFGAT